MTTVSGAVPPAPGTAVRIMVDGRPVAVFNIAGELRGVDSACTHVGGPLERGTVTDGIVTCPLHGSKFDTRTGAVVRGPAVKPVRAYRVTVAPGGLSFEPL